MDTNFEFTEGDRGNMILNEKLAKNSKLRGFKLRGLRRNQISTLDYIYPNDRCNKINILGDF